jgi:hypothetical protein
MSRCWDCRKHLEDGLIRCDDCVKSKQLPASYSKSPGAWERRTSVERTVFSKDTLQPYKKDGTVNEKFLKSYGKEAYKNWGESNPQPYKRKSW